MKTIWKEVKGFTNYFVSNKGDIMSRWRKDELILKYRINKKGYCKIGLSKDKRSHQRCIHRLVAIAFIENPFNKEQVNHKDGVKTNNNVNNLEWVTPMENIDHAFMTGISPSGENHSSAKLTEKSVADMRILHAKGGITYTELAKIHNVSRPAISAAIRMKTWTRSLQTPTKTTKK
jgi:hypothetical protein